MVELVTKFSEKTSTDYVQILNRNKTIEKSHTLNVQERIKNIKNSIDILGDVAGKNILILDNVCTSGTSLLDAANLLLKKGAKIVVGLCLLLSAGYKDSDWSDLNHILKYSQIRKFANSPYLPKEKIEKYYQEMNSFVKLMGLKTIEGIGPSKIIDMLKDSDLDSAYERMLRKHPEVRDKEKYFEKVYQFSKKSKIEIISCFDERYPSKLKGLTSPPLILFMKGNLSLIDNSIVSIVGSRESSKETLGWASKISRELSGLGHTIISGGALGVDAVAHAAALSEKGRTICILGSGIGNVYPKENTELINNIIANDGLVISQLPPFDSGDRFSLLERNRMTSGFSDLVIVSSSNEKGGSISQIKNALSQKKTIVCPKISLDLKPNEGLIHFVNEGKIQTIENSEDVVKLL